MTSQQVQTLEFEYLKTELRDKIDYELKQKLGLFLTHEMSAYISWCAMLVCWIELFLKAEQSFEK